MFFKIAQKVAKYFGFFCNNICFHNFQKSPNMVTLFAAEKAFNESAIKKILKATPWWWSSGHNVPIKANLIKEIAE